MNECNQPCDRCAGKHSIENCPNPNKDETPGPDDQVIFWPPVPDAGSWYTDTPNEGIWYEEGCVVSAYEDYHGFYLIEPGETVQQFILPPERNPVYDNAYRELKQALEQSQERPIRETFIDVFIKLGWKQVVACDIQESALLIRYFKFKD